MAIQQRAAGDVMPPKCKVIEIRVPEPQQVFLAIDPSPFGDRQLDPDIEEFILHQAGEAAATAPLGLLVDLDRPATEDDAAGLKQGIHQFFQRRAAAARQELRDLFHRGRISLVIGLAFLGTTSTLAHTFAGALEGRALGAILRESLLIGGWVAMWRPLEVYLYDWWPIRARARRYDRLAEMPVGVRYAPR